MRQLREEKDFSVCDSLERTKDFPDARAYRTKDFPDATA
jgi:hypothetical protein